MIFEYRGKIYPDFLMKWGMSKYIIPIAQNFCKGKGVDIGPGDDPFPGAIPVDILKDDKYDAFNLPAEAYELDYVFSSHCLEHVGDFVGAIEYWLTKLKSGGTLFLYLPHWDCEYWRPWNNRKHKHQFEPHHIKDCLETIGLKDVLVSERDMAHSFSAVGWKR